MFEWVEDDYHDSYGSAPNDGSAWTDSPRGTSRVLRGGSWNLSPRHCRSANRSRNSPAYRDDYFGFRVVLVR